MSSTACRGASAMVTVASAYAIILPFIIGSLSVTGFQYPGRAGLHNSNLNYRSSSRSVAFFGSDCADPSRRRDITSSFRNSDITADSSTSTRTRLYGRNLGYDVFSTNLKKKKLEYNEDEDGYNEMFRTRRRFPGYKLLKRGLSKIKLGGRKREPGKLIILRHGESLWNFNKTFTGWHDADLSDKGYREAEHASRLLIEAGYDIDVVFTSRLVRAIRTCWIVLSEMNEVYLPVFKSWRLNERMYGALTGLDKISTAKKIGPEIVQEWRSSLRSRPPSISKTSEYWPGRDRRYNDLSDDQIPLTESLEDCMVRTFPLWEQKIKNDLRKGRNVLVVAHANSIRGLIKIIDDISDDDIQEVSIPTGIPIVYNFDKAMKPICPEGDVSCQIHTNGVFMETPGLLAAALKREEEWAILDPEFQNVMTRNTRSSASNVERSLAKLQAERDVADWAVLTADPDADEDDDGSDGGGGRGIKFAGNNGKVVDGAAGKGAIGERNNNLSVVAPLVRGACVVPNGGDETVPIRRAPVVVIIRHGKTENNKLGLFTGWDDAPLAKEGFQEAKEAGQLLKSQGFEFDVVYTSWLSRAMETAWLILDELESLWVPTIKTWRLNERMYGALTGLSKSMVKQRYGEKKFKMWRRGYKVRPLRASSFSPNYPGNDKRYVKYLRDIRFSVSESVIRSFESGKFSLHRKFPKTESLKDCMDRTIPFYVNRIVPDAVEKGKRVLISSSENAIRGLLMHLCDIPEEKISQLDIPNGVPIVYDPQSRCIKLLDDGSGRNPLEVHNFGPAAEYLFAPRCIDANGDVDEDCDIRFLPDSFWKSEEGAEDEDEEWLEAAADVSDGKTNVFM